MEILQHCISKSADRPLATKAAFNQIVTQTQDFTAYLVPWWEHWDIRVNRYFVHFPENLTSTSFAQSRLTDVPRSCQSLLRPCAKGVSQKSQTHNLGRLKALWGIPTNPGLHDSPMDQSAVQFLRRRSMLLSRGRMAAPVECWAVPGKQLPK